MTDSGLLVVDKPGGMTSHDVVARAAGHSAPARSATPAPSTRWPPASSCSASSRATRLLGHLALHDKRYSATIRLGATTVTDDAEGEVVDDRRARRARGARRRPRSPRRLARD